jgi:hypothetical protein
MSHVFAYIEFEMIPVSDALRNCGIGVREVESSYSGEKLPLVRIILPVFELPVVSINKDGNDSLPSSVSETCNTIIDIKSDFASIYYPGYVGVNLSILRCFIFINSSFKEFLYVSNG